MTPEQLEAATESDYDERTKTWSDRRARNRAQKSRYEAMLAKVREWLPPTADHVGLKDFMIQQLTESIRFDCSPNMDKYDPLPDPISGREWRAKRLESLTRDIEYHSKENVAEIACTNGRNEWLAELRKSVGSPTPRASPEPPGDRLDDRTTADYPEGD